VGFGAITCVEPTMAIEPTNTPRWSSTGREFPHRKPSDEENNPT
jgi:hypothetical protein